MFSNSFNRSSAVIRRPTFASTNEIDVIDPDYKFPQLIRGNIGYDRTLFFGLTGTAEVLFSQTIRDIRYENVNLVQTGTRPIAYSATATPAKTSAAMAQTVPAEGVHA